MALAARQTRGKVKKVPQRSCVGCGRTTNKRDLIRVVRTITGTVEADDTGKKAGRGAYLCRSQDCWQQALKKNRLAHALRTTIVQTDQESLIRYANDHAAEWLASTQSSEREQKI